MPVSRGGKPRGGGRRRVMGVATRGRVPKVGADAAARAAATTGARAVAGPRDRLGAARDRLGAARGRLGTTHARGFRLADLAGAHRLFGILSLLLVVGLGATLFLTSSAFGVSEIQVVGSTHLSSADVVRLCGVELGTNLLKVPTRAIRDGLLASPRVAEATVSRRLPGTIIVRVVEREGVALLLSGQQYAEFDQSGLPVEFHRLISALGLPVITGVAVDGITLGTRVEGVDLGSALAVAAALGTSGRARISEVAVDQAGELVLYTRDGIPVYIGPAMGLEAKVTALLDILDDIQANDLDVSYVDVRYPRYPAVGSAGGPTQPAEWQWADPDIFPVLGGEP